MLRAPPARLLLATILALAVACGDSPSAPADDSPNGPTDPPGNPDGRLAGPG